MRIHPIAETFAIKLFDIQGHQRKSKMEHTSNPFTQSHWTKLVGIFFFLVTYSLAVNAQDFRSVNWGMSLKQVVEKEAKDPKTHIAEIGDSDLVFELELAEMDFRLKYVFEKDKLTSAHYERYQFEETFPNAREGEVNYMRNLLSQKYGEPYIKTDREEQWKQFLWEDKDKSILLEFVYKEDKPSFIISYTPKK